MKSRFSNYVGLFKRAYLATRREIRISFVALIAISLVLVVLLWVAEGLSNKEYSIVDSIVWVFVKYVDDPAEIAIPPATVLGQIIGTLVGALGIAIFAVPTGLIGSGLISAMDAVKEEEETAENSKRLHKRFRRIAESESWFYNENKMKVTLHGVPRYRSFSHIKMKTGMTEDEIIRAVNSSCDMRLMNLAVTKRGKDRAIDDLVVVNFPVNTEYGCFLDNGSDVTIVAPVALTEPGTSSFAYSLAMMGGFNFVSRELNPNPDDPFGFYSMRESNLDLIDEEENKEIVKAQASHFMADLQSLKRNSEKAGRKHWFIMLMGTSKSEECQVHLWRLATDSKNKMPDQLKGDVRYGSTVLTASEEHLQQIFSSLTEKLSVRSVEVNNNKQPIVVCLDNNRLLKSLTPSNIMCRLGGGVSCNAVTLRIGYEVLFYHSQHLSVAKDIADTIKGVIEPDKEIPQELKNYNLKSGVGYVSRSGALENDYLKLQELVDDATKLSCEKYKSYDLNGEEIV